MTERGVQLEREQVRNRRSDAAYNSVPLPPLLSGDCLHNHHADCDEPSCDCGCHR